jgi:uncharacterized membrane protein YtjA (UPF0391 family)
LIFLLVEIVAGVLGFGYVAGVAGDNRGSSSGAVLLLFALSPARRKGV